MQGGIKMPAKGYRKEQGQRPMRSLFVLQDERALAKRIAKLVKHGTDEQRAALREYAQQEIGKGYREGTSELRAAYTIRAYDNEWEIINGVMSVAKRRNGHQPTRAFVTKLENAILHQ